MSRNVEHANVDRNLESMYQGMVRSGDAKAIAEFRQAFGIEFCDSLGFKQIPTARESATPQRSKSRSSVDWRTDICRRRQKLMELDGSPQLAKLDPFIRRLKLAELQ